MSSASLRALACSRCGAPLRVQPGQRIVNCTYCGASHAFIPPPPAAPPGVSFQPGERVAVEWGGVWWPARVVRATGPGRWLINYADWDTAWDEEVDRSRIRRRSSGIGGRRAGSGALLFAVIASCGLALVGAGLFALVRYGAATTESAAPDYSAGATYRQGEAVKVWWKSTWYDGHIVSVKGDGKYEIAYDGWSESWNETVTNKRLRKKPGVANAAPASTARGTAVPIDIADQPPARQGQYQKGQAVTIEWHGRWWPGRIRAVLGKDRYLIHYDGYSASWDETVDPSRLKAR